MIILLAFSDTEVCNVFVRISLMLCRGFSFWKCDKR